MILHPTNPGHATHIFHRKGFCRFVIADSSVHFSEEPGALANGARGGPVSIDLSKVPLPPSPTKQKEKTKVVVVDLTDEKEEEDPGVGSPKIPEPPVKLEEKIPVEVSPLVQEVASASCSWNSSYFVLLCL